MKTLSILGLSFIVSLVAACATQTDVSEDGADDTSGSAEALSVGAQFLQGAWKADGGLEGFDIRPNGEFIYDRTLIMNGIIMPSGSSSGGAPFTHLDPRRETGKVTVSTAKRTITFKGTDATKVYSYEYRVPRTGPAILSLTLVKVGTRAVPGVQVDFKKADSWCTAAADCDQQEADRTWDPRAPMDAPLRNVCKSGNTCGWEFHAPDPVVVARCTPIFLNGIIDPRTMRTVEVEFQSRGFFPGVYAANVKQGGATVQTLSCEGTSASAWDLTCTSDPHLLGSTTTFKMLDKSTRSAEVRSHVVAPDAPENVSRYGCEDLTATR